MNAEGKWSLAPAYDLTYSHGASGLHALSVAGNRKQPGRIHFHDVARIVGIEREDIWDMISAVDAALARWPEFSEACSVPRLLRNAIQDDIERARTWT